MEIAIIGAGFSGLASAWNLAKIGRVTIFDPVEIGKGTSGIAAGLLNPFTGAHSKKNRRSDEGLEATLRLLKVAENALGSSVYQKTGIVRPALSYDQKQDFAIAAEKNPGVIRWLDAKMCYDIYPYLPPFEGIYVDPVYVVNTEKYLQGLWLACKSRGVIFEQRAIQSLEELDQYDRIVAAMGGGTKLFSEFSHMRLTLIKGQILKFPWPDSTPSLAFPLNSQAYLINESRTGILGATFERDFTSLEPNLQIALDDLLPKLGDYFPFLDREMSYECKAGVRVSAPRHMPLLERYNERCWILTGMGSKGLLYHALYAEELFSNF